MTSNLDRRRLGLLREQRERQSQLAAGAAYAEQAQAERERHQTMELRQAIGEFIALMRRHKVASLPVYTSERLKERMFGRTSLQFWRYLGEGWLIQRHFYVNEDCSQRGNILLDDARLMDTGQNDPLRREPHHRGLEHDSFFACSGTPPYTPPSVDTLAEAVNRLIGTR